MQILQNYSSIACYQAVIGVNRRDAVHPPQGEDKLLSAAIWRCAGDHAAIPALRNQRNFVFARKLYHRGNLLRVGRGKQGR
jgi:hypothetical protein